MWSPLVVPMKVCHMFCSLPAGDHGLHWSNPHFGQEGVTLVQGVTGWVVERHYSFLQPQATDDQARDPH